MGGLHVTSVPEEPARFGASAVIGEGETVWPEVLADAEAGALKWVYDARGREFDMATAPMPAFELLDMSKYNRITVQTSRGCPWRCSFCASSILLTRRYKQKPAEKVLAEIDKIRDVVAPALHRIRRRQRLRPPRLVAAVPARAAEAPGEVVRRDRRLGGGGPGAAGPDARSRLRRGADRLREPGGGRVWTTWNSAATGSCIRFGQYRNAIRTIQSHGIRVNACFVLGLDGHGPGIFDSVYKFVEETAPYDVQITYQTPFPGTPLYRQLNQQNRLTHDERGNAAPCST